MTNQRYTYGEQQTNVVRAFLQDVGATMPTTSPVDEFNSGIDLSVCNQKITDCQLRCGTKHHFIAYENWSLN